MRSQITVIGLGPGRAELITRESWEALNKADEVYLRTSEHPAVDSFPDNLVIRSFDHLYQSADDFDEVYSQIIDDIVEIAEARGRVLYGVPGDPFVGEATVLGLMRRAEENDIELIIKPGVSFIEPCLHILGIDALDGVQISDALNLASSHHPPLSPDRPALIAQLHSQFVAADVKLTLLNQYPQDHPVTLIHCAGSDKRQIESIVLVNIDRSNRFSSCTSLYLPPLEKVSAFESFQETVAHLRAPNGCPWDRDQTHATLRMHLLEECYEALHAIDRGDMEALREELGDLTLQIVLQTQIATEGGDFRMTDVLSAINEKIMRRHPHVFDELQLEGVPDVLHNWEVLKAEERQDEGKDQGLLEGVPMVLPSLSQANELQSRASRVGFDWKDLKGVIEKIAEEFTESLGAETAIAREAEIGDLLFAIVNYARWIHVDPESALRQANSRFRKRFNHIERWALAKDKKLTEMTMEEMDAIWEGAKGLPE